MGSLKQSRTLSITPSVTRNNTDSDSGGLALSFPEEKDGDQWPGSQVSVW